METISINKYRDIIRMYHDERNSDEDSDVDTEIKLTKNDITLVTKLAGLYKFNRKIKLLEVISFLRDESVCKESLELADKLEALLNADEAAASDAPCQVSPVKPDEAMNLDIFPTTNIVTSDKISTTDSKPKAPRCILPPVFPKITPENPFMPELNTNDGTGALQQLKSDAISDMSFGEVFYIGPDEHFEVHELASALPMMEGDIFEQFKSSIKEGQQFPVITHKGKLADGRNRRRACLELNLPTMAVEYLGKTPIEELITAWNIHRRNLNKNQLGAYAAKLLPSIEKKAAERMTAGVKDPVVKLRQGSKSRSVDIAGEMVGVSGSYVLNAKKVLESSPEAYQEIVNGKLTIAEAQKQIKTPNAMPEQPEPKLLTIAECVTRLVELIPAFNNDPLRDIAENSPPQVKKVIMAWLNQELPASTDENTSEELNQDSA